MDPAALSDQADQVRKVSVLRYPRALAVWKSPSKPSMRAISVGQRTAFNAPRMDPQGSPAPCARLEARRVAPRPGRGSGSGSSATTPPARGARSLRIHGSFSFNFQAVMVSSRCFVVSAIATNRLGVRLSPWPRMDTAQRRRFGSGFSFSSSLRQLVHQTGERLHDMALGYRNLCTRQECYSPCRRKASDMSQTTPRIYPGSPPVLTQERGELAERILAPSRSDEQHRLLAPSHVDEQRHVLIMPVLAGGYR